MPTICKGALAFEQKISDLGRRRPFQIQVDRPHSHPAAASNLPLPKPQSNLNRSNSLVFRMDFLLAGTLFSFMHGVSMPRHCPALLRPSSVHLWKTFRSKPNTIPVDGQNCSPSHRNRVHLQTGMLFGITTECCSASDRNRVHLRPDSPL